MNGTGFLSDSGDSWVKVSDAIGMSSNVVCLILLSVAIGVAIFSYRHFRSIILSIISGILPIGFGVFLGIIPFWMFLIALMFSISLGGYNLYCGNYGVKVNHKRKKQSETIAQMEINNEEKEIQVDRSSLNSPKLINKYTKLSAQYQEYQNNLDNLLNIETHSVRSILKYPEPLTLRGNRLFIREDYHWFIIGKSLNKDMFKVVGVSKVNENILSFYYIGNNDNIPYLYDIEKLPKIRSDGKYNTNNVEEEIAEYALDSSILGDYLGEVKTLAKDIC
jgi:hypothetical protein